MVPKSTNEGEKGPKHASNEPEFGIQRFDAISSSSTKPFHGQFLNDAEQLSSSSEYVNATAADQQIRVLCDLKKTTTRGDHICYD